MTMLSHDPNSPGPGIVDRGNVSVVAVLLNVTQYSAAKLSHIGNMRLIALAEGANVGRRNLTLSRTSNISIN